MACTVNIVFKTCFYLQVVHLFRTQFVYADKVDIRSKEIEKEEKISTSLKIESGHSRNKTEKVTSNGRELFHSSSCTFHTRV